MRPCGSGGQCTDRLWLVKKTSTGKSFKDSRLQKNHAERRCSVELQSALQDHHRLQMKVVVGLETSQKRRKLKFTTVRLNLDSMTD
jgi:hypothetical protein